MDHDKFKRIYNERRNGCNDKIRHPMVRQFVYSDGVQELAETGCYWLLDVIGTEFVIPLRQNFAALQGFGFVYVTVKDSGAEIKLVRDSGEPSLYTREIEYTDMPDGTWQFCFSDEGDHAFLILPSEY